MNVKQVLPPDAIPSVDDPEFVDRYPGDPDDEVVVVEQGSDVRAYPIRYLNYHEIVNDALDGRPVAVTWCPLCAIAVVYERVVGGRTLEFGVSGKLADDDLVMYDRETGSEWKQSLGEAIAGEYDGTELTILPSAVTSYEQFAETYPDGVVLDEPGGESEASGPGDDPQPVEYDDDPYRDYFETDGFGLAAHRGTGGRNWERDDLDPKAVVLGVERDGEALGFPYERVEAADGVVQATVGEESVVVFVTSNGIHAFAAEALTFEPADEDGTFAADGTTWDGATGVAADGRQLRRLPSRRLFAFAWQDDHGSASFYDG